MTGDATTRFREWASTLADIGGASALLGWDRETAMPPSGAESRAQQLGTLAAMHHRELIRPDMAAVLDEMEHDDTLGPVQRREVYLMARGRRRAQRLSEDLVRRLSEAASRSVNVWLEEKPHGRYAEFVPAFRAVVDLKREQARALSDGGDPYDALLEDYEPGTRVADLEPLFARLQQALPELVAQGASRPTAALPGRRWPVEAQVALGRDVAEMVGYDLSGGAVALSAHPFTNSPGYGDVRITTRVDEGNPVDSLMSVLHETGHALYEQGFDAAHARTALLDAPSMGAHESQSRFWENHIGRSRAFWTRVEPMLRSRFPHAMTGLDATALHRVAAAVRPSLVRVESDEVTYNLHIVLRFELEVALIRGQLQVEDLPDEWNRRMRDLLGLVPPHDGLGVMQDIHWAEGLVAYFPTYTVGTLYAAQLAEAADLALGGLERAVTDGRFVEILAFMRERVHRFGNVHPTPELMRRATGRDLSADALIAHLRSVVAA